MSQMSNTLKALIAINVVVYVLWHTLDPELLAPHFIVSRDAILDFRIWTLLGSAFSHIRPWHLLFNCMALYVFGRGVEQVVGPSGLVRIYVAGGILASLAHVVVEPTVGALGASGAAMALAVCYAGWFPDRKLVIIPFPVPIAARWVVLGYIGIDLLGLTGQVLPWIAHAAHLGGAAYGAFEVWSLARRTVQPQ